MTFHERLQPIDRFFKENSTTILTSIGVSGTITTAYLASKASFQAARVIDDDQEDDYGRMPAQTKREALKTNVRLVWKLYVPAVASGVITIGCTIAAAKVGAKRTAAAYSLLAVSEKALIEYSDKVREQIGDKKEQGIRDAIAQDRVAANPTSGIVVVESGNVLCYEAHTGRYFNSNIEALRKAENAINAKMIREMDASLADFYHMIRLPQTTYSHDQGWYSDKMMELRFTTVMSEDERPCLSFDYNYIKPLYGGMRE